MSDLADVREELESGQAAGLDGAAQEVLVQIAAGRELVARNVTTTVCRPAVTWN